MLVFSYGIPKSGSTLAFELAKGVARLAGHRQRRLPAAVRGRHRVNFLQHLDPAELEALARGAEDRILVVKTHAVPGTTWIGAYERLAARGQVRAHVNHRDPRDICLSLLDAGRLARARGEAAFAEFVTLADAEARVRRYLDELVVWSRLPAALTLRYEVCAFATDVAIRAIAADLGVRCPAWPVRVWVQRVAFTYRNKALPARHRRELPTGEIEWLSAAFAPYLRRMGYGDPAEISAFVLGSAARTHLDGDGERRVTA